MDNLFKDDEEVQAPILFTEKLSFSKRLKSNSAKAWTSHHIIVILLSIVVLTLLVGGSAQLWNSRQKVTEITPITPIDISNLNIDRIQYDNERAEEKDDGVKKQEVSVTQQPVQNIAPSINASNSCSSSSSKTCPHPKVDSAIYGASIFVIRYLPDTNGDGTIDFSTTGYTGSVNALRQETKDKENETAWWLTEASRYKGYKNPSAKPSLGYAVYGEKEYTTNPPIGDPVPWNTSVNRPDYKKMLNANNICNLVDSKGVDQVWVWTQHYGNIEPVETNLSSSYGDISNSEQTDDLPHCNKPYMLFNYNFTRGVAEAVHNHGHQLEAFLKHNDVDGLFWNNFVGSSNGSSSLTSNPRSCGWTHYAPNASTDYQTYETNIVSSDCEDWRPNGNGTTKSVNCATWQKHAYGSSNCINDGGLSFYVWWMQNLPGYNNTLTNNSKNLRNWWDYYGNLDAVLGSNKYHYK